MIPKVLLGKNTYYSKPFHKATQNYLKAVNGMKAITSFDKHGATQIIFWGKVFKRGVRKFCGRQPLKSLKEYGLLKGAPSGLRQFLATKNPLKMMRNAFYFTSKALLVLKIFKFLPQIFGHVAKRLDKKDKVNFKFNDVTPWLTNNRNTRIAQYFEK